MEYLLIVLLAAAYFAAAHYIHQKNMKLLCLVSSPDRGTPAERKLIIKLLKKGIHPKAIFHDLYLPKRNGDYAQTDIVVATPQGLIVMEIKEYSGWLFGHETQRYWTQLLNYGREKYRFYNPLMQNANHIKTLREQSPQLAKLPMYNVVLFAGSCKLKEVNYTSDNTFVGYTGDIMYILNQVSCFRLANYTDKKEVVRILRQAVRNGSDPGIVARHIASVQYKSRNQPLPSIDWHIRWKKWWRF